MKKYFKHILLVTFLFMQVAAFMHVIQHDNDAHHDAKNCDIHFFMDHYSGSEGALKIAKVTPQLKFTTYVFFEESALISFNTSKFSARAPPLFS